MALLIDAGAKDVCPETEWRLNIDIRGGTGGCEKKHI